MLSLGNQLFIFKILRLINHQSLKKPRMYYEISSFIVWASEKISDVANLGEGSWRAFLLMEPPEEAVVT